MATRAQQRGASQKRPGDATGRQVEVAQAEKERKDAEEQARLTMVNQQQVEYDQSVVVDYSDPQQPVERPLEEGDIVAQPGLVQPIGADPVLVIEDEVQQGEPTLNVDSEEQMTVRSEQKTAIIQVAEDIDFHHGYGNKYDLKAGRNYKVPVEVADSLQEKGWLAFRGR